MISIPTNSTSHRTNTSPNKSNQNKPIPSSSKPHVKSNSACSSRNSSLDFRQNQQKSSKSLQPSNNINNRRRSSSTANCHCEITANLDSCHSKVVFSRRIIEGFLYNLYNCETETDCHDSVVRLFEEYYNDFCRFIAMYPTVAALLKKSDDHVKSDDFNDDFDGSAPNFTNSQSSSFKNSKPTVTPPSETESESVFAKKSVNVDQFSVDALTSEKLNFEQTLNYDPKFPHKFSPRSINDLSNEAEKNFSEFEEEDSRFCHLAITIRNIRLFLASIFRLKHRSYLQITRDQANLFLSKINRENRLKIPVMETSEASAAGFNCSYIVPDVMSWYFGNSHSDHQNDHPNSELSKSNNFNQQTYLNYAEFDKNHKNRGGTLGIFEEIYFRTKVARIDNINYTLAYHAEYLRLLKEVEWGMVEWNGWKNGKNTPGIGYLLAIMAVKQHDCTYLARNLEHEYKIRGFGNQNGYGNSGVPSIFSFSDLPLKLQKLNKLNYILAKRPWSLECSDFREVMVAKNGETVENFWNFEELLMALMIFTHYHTKCSLVFSLKIKPEIDSYDGHDLQKNIQKVTPKINDWKTDNVSKNEQLYTNCNSQIPVKQVFSVNSNQAFNSPLQAHDSSWNSKILKTTQSENVLIRNPNLEHIKNEIIVSPSNQASSYKTAERFMQQGLGTRVSSCDSTMNLDFFDSLSSSPVGNVNRPITNLDNNGSSGSFQPNFQNTVGNGGINSQTGPIFTASKQPSFFSNHPRFVNFDFLKNSGQHGNSGENLAVPAATNYTSWSDSNGFSNDVMYKLKFMFKGMDSSMLLNSIQSKHDYVHNREKCISSSNNEAVWRCCQMFNRVVFKGYNAEYKRYLGSDFVDFIRKFVCKPETMKASDKQQDILNLKNILRNLEMVEHEEEDIELENEVDLEIEHEPTKTKTSRKTSEFSSNPDNIVFLSVLLAEAKLHTCLWYIVEKMSSCKLDSN